MAPFATLAKHRDLGLLILRVGVGVMFITHGVPKLARGVDGWERLGRTMELVGIGFAPTLWGLLAALAETLGGLCLALGLWTRAACLPLVFTMVMAAVNHLAKGDGFGKASHAIEACFVFAGIFFAGPGRYSFDRR
ncbi:MAG TPA: DoxX family protein [Polyangiaceae bacterium]